MASERLINTNAELKGALSVVQADLDFKSIASFVDDAEQKHIIPAIGLPLYAALREASLTTEQAYALKLLRRAVANFTIHYYAAFGSVQISETGIFVSKGADYLPASDKKVLMLRAQARAAGFEALETAVNYLEANLAAFGVYASDAAHTQNRSLYTNTTAEFETGFNIGGNAELFSRLRTVIAEVESDSIDNVLGATVATALRAAVLAGTPTDPQKNLLTRIRKCTSQLAIAESIPYQMVSFGANGAITANLKGNTENVEETNPADMARLQRVMNAAIAKGQSAQAALIKWLDANVADFTGYVPSVADTGGMNDDLNGIYIL